MSEFNNKDFDEFMKEFEEADNELDKSMKRSQRNDIKKLILAFTPMLLLPLYYVMPASFASSYITFWALSSMTLFGILGSKKFLKHDEEIDKEINKNINKLGQIKIGKNKTNVISKDKNKGVTKKEEKKIITNQLSECVDLQYYEEYMLGKFNFMKEQYDIKIETFDDEVIKEFLNPIRNVLGNDVKIISTFDLESDMIAKMYKKSYPVKSFCYLYDGNKFYAYSPKTNAFILFPMRSTDMFNIYISDDSNQKKTTVAQFFSEIYGDIDDLNDGKKRK